MQVALTAVVVFVMNTYCFVNQRFICLVLFFTFDTNAMYNVYIFFFILLFRGMSSPSMFAVESPNRAVPPCIATSSPARLYIFKAKKNSQPPVTEYARVGRQVLSVLGRFFCLFYVEWACAGALLCRLKHPLDLSVGV